MVEGWIITQLHLIPTALASTCADGVTLYLMAMVILRGRQDQFMMVNGSFSFLLANEVILHAPNI